MVPDGALSLKTMSYSKNIVNVSRSRAYNRQNLKVCTERHSLQYRDALCHPDCFAQIHQIQEKSSEILLILSSELFAFIIIFLILLLLLFLHRLLVKGCDDTKICTLPWLSSSMTVARRSKTDKNVEKK